VDLMSSFLCCAGSSDIYDEAAGQVTSPRTLPEGEHPRASSCVERRGLFCTDPFPVSHGCCLAEGDAYARHHVRGVGEYPELIGPGR